MNRVPLQPLNVGELIGQSFAVVFGRLPILFGLALLPSLALAVAFAELQRRFFIATSFWDASAPTEFALQVVPLVAIAVLAFSIANGFVILAARDVAFGPRIAIGRQVLQLIRSLPALIATSVVAIIVITLPFGLIASVYYALPELSLIPNLLAVLLTVASGVSVYLMARVWVFLPAVLVGEDGMNAIRRATVLSYGYRWPILGALLLLFLIDLCVVLIFSIVLGFAMQFLLGTRIDFDANFSAEVLALNALVYTFISVLMAVFSVHLYSRLRELKEGLGLGDVAAIFE